MGKMDKKWIILCSTAVAAVYSAGYYTTESQAANNNNQPIHQIAKNVQAKQYTLNGSKANSDQTNNGPQVSFGVTPNANDNNTVSKAAPVNSSQKSSKYKNGTFTGQGMNRRGMMQVQVTIQNDKITDVQISSWGMHYSESDVVGLPDEVLKNQSSQVTNVSGATYSSQAFEDAVQDALNQAQNTAG
ncbi:FMN-binding protein [Bacillus sp. BRMEA1]|uniref:FMN-binding protein n=1 Tax=Neobacillus endophyticus TaxID=2738405 RepID=UPI0015677B16|nr:FMN-binding protein [Neobacillus endophyticus]NRD77887.1 FMN-binding protein [Neobacillus endophyticus]